MMGNLIMNLELLYYPKAREEEQKVGFEPRSKIRLTVLALMTRVVEREYAVLGLLRRSGDQKRVHATVRVSARSIGKKSAKGKPSSRVCKYGERAIRGSAADIRSSSSGESTVMGEVKTSIKATVQIERRAKKHTAKQPPAKQPPAKQQRCAASAALLAAARMCLGGPLHSFGRETADALNYSLSARRYTLLASLLTRY
ncbi:hypothetical protein BHM03_00000671 [Ensete ventricosum]|nr:hypothetical protein BHM03_00000671 [Ensete ventricosum]